MSKSFTAIPLIKEFSDIDSDFRPYDLATADFDQDNRLDIISDRNVFLGDGTGYFKEVIQPDTVRTALATATQRATSDLNQDGKADVVALTSDRVTVLLGDGSGSFSSIQTFTAGINSTALGIADFNQDNIPDVITTNSGKANDRTTQNISILLGNSDGTLNPAKSIQVPGRPLNSVTGDFNGDGKKDIAVLSRQGKTQLTVLQGNGKGSFKKTQSILLGKSYSPHIVSGDFNKDGKTDVATVNGVLSYRSGIGSETLSVLFGTRHGTLNLHNQFLSIDPSESSGNLIKEDMNGDGQIDLVMTRAFSGFTGGSVLLGSGKGDFSREADEFEASVSDDRSDMSNAYDIVQGDFNGDGKLDLATADGSAYTEGRITIFLNNITNRDAVALSDDAADGSSEQSGSLTVSLSKHTLKYNGSTPFTTKLDKYVNTVIGTPKSDSIQGDSKEYGLGREDNFLNGYGGNDVITGLGGRDRLIGGAGDDKIAGGSGRDKFVFSSTPNYPEGLNRAFERSPMGVDQVVDFQPGEDKIILDGGTFTALDLKIQFASVSDKSAAETSRAILTYVQDTGSLYYNSNGSGLGFGAGGLFAEFRNQASLSAKDFSVFL